LFEDRAMADQPSFATPVTKRAFLGGVGGSAAAVAVGPPLAAEGLRTRPLPAMAGTLDLNSVPIVDTHMHPLSRALISAKYAEQAESFTKAVLPSGDYPGKAALKAKLLAEFGEQVMGVSRRIGYFNYVARNHGVAPTIAGFDSVLAANSGSDAAFASFTKSVLDRENVAFVLLQSRSHDPVRPASALPQDRFEWTYHIADFATIAWARANGHTRIEDVVARIDRLLETAVANGCRGFKNDSTYYRSLTLHPASPRDAAAAMDTLLPLKPSGETSEGRPIYDGDDANRAIRTYADYLFKHIYERAGQLGRPMIIHSAVVLHPALRLDYNDPAPLYDILTDPAIVSAGTHFVVIHTGYPAHHLLAAMNSQFPRLHVDLSHIAKYPGALEETLRALIGVGPTTKIMHGSDTGTIPEEIGYCAWNTRRALANILSEYKRDYGWLQSDIETAARNILSGNAMRLFDMGKR
jgi:predicted TIM-barrel fold metal-dependent hydrolase